MSTWVLLRGLTRETRHWGRFPSILHDAVETDSLLQLDLPGNGALVDQRAPADVASMVGFVRLALSQSSVPGPYRVLAMSLGGDGGYRLGAALSRRDRTAGAHQYEHAAV